MLRTTCLFKSLKVDRKIKIHQSRPTFTSSKKHLRNVVKMLRNVGM